MDNAPVQPTDIQPADGNPQTPPVDTPQEQAGSLPPDVLKLHPIQAMIAGAPAAVSAPIASFKKSPEAEKIVKYAPQLQEAGFGFYKSLSGDLGVIFNSLHIHPQDLQNADKQGKLEQLAPPWNHVDHIISKSGINHPALSGKPVPGAPASPMPPPPPQAGSGLMPKPEPAGVAKKEATARLLALQPGAPTSGPVPGGGRLLNSILKPVV